MTNRLIAALENTETALKKRAQRYECCGFCGETPYAIIKGPLVGICEPCANNILGMYLVAHRDNLDLERDLSAIIERTRRDQYLRFNEIPPEAAWKLRSTVNRR